MLTYLEDFLEYIGGFKDNQGSSTGTFPFSNNIRLANYDQNIVGTMSYQTFCGIALTDRQHTLAVKLVNKYRKQLQQKGIVVPEELPLRMALRIVDRSMSISYNEHLAEFHIRFPFNAALVDELRSFTGLNCGTVVFDREKRIWTAAATIPNLIWLANWAQEKNFEIKFDHNQLLEKFYNDLSIPRLKLAEGSCRELVIENNPGSMDISELNQPGQNLLQAITRASEWQVTVDPDVAKCAEQTGFDPQWVEWSSRRMIHVRPGDQTEEKFFQWLETVNLWPVLWHSSNAEDFANLKNYFGSDRVCKLNTKQKIEKLNPVQNRLIIFSETTKSRSTIPVGVFVTRQSIIYLIKNNWGQTSKKIVYWGDRFLTDVVS